MSGHSKWSTIKRKKGVLDAKRGQIFTKMAKLVMVAAKQGGGDPETNFKLRLAVDKARSVNMPSANVERAIKKGTGESAEGNQLEELVYEAYGPGGVALIIEAVTDNKNRTLPEIKTILSDHGGRLGETGSVQWMFKKQGVVVINKPADDKKEMAELVAIEAGADDIKEEDGDLVIYTKSNQLTAVKESLEEAGLTIDSADVELSPTNPLNIKDKSELERIERLMMALDEQEDVNEVYSNLAE